VKRFDIESSLNRLSFVLGVTGGGIEK
jgi:hypothetical protein